MRIRLNAFVEEIIRRIDHVVIRENRPLQGVPYPMRWLIVARKLVDIGMAVASVDGDGDGVGVGSWRPSNILEARMGDSDVAAPREVEIDQDFSQARDIMRYVAAVNMSAGELVDPAVEIVTADIVAFNKGLLKPVGRDRNGFRRWEQTAMGRKLDSIW